ncbi:MAG TPA: hypothetical protein VKF81_11615 [Blastocatellia bacterium]|nr:hypothetical protein [Blastocatellia bacterium]
MRFGYCNPGDGGLISGCQAQTAAAEPAPHIQNRSAGLNAGRFSQMIRESYLSFLLRFGAGHPVTVVQVLAPELEIIRADQVVMFDDLLFVVVAGHHGCGV